MYFALTIMDWEVAVSSKCLWWALLVLATPWYNWPESSKDLEMQQLDWHTHILPILIESILFGVSRDDGGCEWKIPVVKNMLHWYFEASFKC